MINISKRRPGPRPTKARYAVFAFGKRMTPWRAHRETAVKDAIAGDYASRDDQGQVYFWAECSIESEARRTGEALER